MCTFIDEKEEIKADLKRHVARIIIGRFGGEGALIYPRGNSADVDINDLRPSDKISDVLECDGSIYFIWRKLNSEFNI